MPETASRPYYWLDAEDVLSTRQARAAAAAEQALLDMGAEVRLCSASNFGVREGHRYPLHEPTGGFSGQMPGPHPFTWGRVRKVHTVGHYSIVEYDSNRPSNWKSVGWQPHVAYSVFVNDGRGRVDIGSSWGSLEEALIHAMLVKVERAAGRDYLNLHAYVRSACRVLRIGDDQ